LTLGCAGAAVGDGDQHVMLELEREIEHLDR
jgi:hypothetical protein